MLRNETSGAVQVKLQSIKEKRGNKMNKYQLKEIPTYILIIIEMFLFFMFGSDCENTIIFIISKIINVVLFIALYEVISKYGNKKIIK